MLVLARVDVVSGQGYERRHAADPSARRRWLAGEGRRQPLSDAEHARFEPRVAEGAARVEPLD